MSSFEIVVGRGRPSAPGLAKVDPSQLRDVIDIFVDGANVSARAPADRVYPVLRELAGAVLDLASGTRDKVVVPFHEAPYELVLERQGDRALVTFYRGGNAPEIAIKDRPVSLDLLREAVSSAALNLCARLWAHPESDPRGEELLALCERTRQGPVAPARTRSSPGSLVQVCSRTFTEAPAGTRLAFGFDAELQRGGRSEGTEATDGGVSHPPPTGCRSDLHALLFRGRLAVHAGGQRTVLSRGYLFLRVERLLQACAHLAEAHEAGRPTSVRLESDGLLVGLRLERDTAILTLGERDMPAPLCIRGLGAVEVVEAAARLARELRRELAAVGQGRNLRVGELVRTARRAASAVRGVQADEAVECGDPAPYRASVLREPSCEKDSLAGARRLGFVERWRVEVEGLDLTATFLCGDRLVVTAKKRLFAVDREQGEILWQREAPRAVTLVAGDGLLRLRQDGRATLHGLDDGEPRWSVELRPRAGGGPLGVAPAGVDAPPISVVAEGRNTLTGLDLRTGERRWQFSSRRAGAFRLRRTGRLIHAVSGESAVWGLDLMTGELVWRYTDRDRFRERPVQVQDVLLATATPASGTGAVIHAMDAFSGRPLWRSPLLPSADVPVPVGDAVVVATEGPAGPTFVAMSARTGERLWERTVLEAGAGYQALAIDEALVLHTAIGKLVGLDAASGELRFTTDLGKVRDVPRRLEPVLRGGALFVPSQVVQVVRPRDGGVIHRLGASSPIPDFLRVDERFALYVGEDSGVLACYGMGAQLALVRS
jgi:outer membrane protein assembly factor BamB